MAASTSTDAAHMLLMSSMSLSTSILSWAWPFGLSWARLQTLVSDSEIQQPEDIKVQRKGECSGGSLPTGRQKDERIRRRRANIVAYAERKI